jgi:hypothetical protein
MDTSNVFIGKASVPTADENATVLGKTAVLWEELGDWFGEQWVTGQEWTFYSSKAGWSLRLKVKTSSISPPLWLLPRRIYLWRQGGYRGALERSLQNDA